MNRVERTSALTLIFFLATYSMAEPPTTQTDPGELTKQAMAQIAAGNMLDGIESLRDHLVISIAEFDAAREKIELQLPMIAKRFGDSIGYEFIGMDEVGTCLRQYVYIQKLERHVLVWKFRFYKPRDQWLLNAFKYDDKTLSLF